MEKKTEIANGKSFTCFECGKKRHIKIDCAIFLKKQLMERKAKSEKKVKKAYIVWDGKYTSSTSSNSSSQEEANLCLMAKKDDASLMKSTNDEVDSNVSLDLDQLINAFNYIHNEA